MHKSAQALFDAIEQADSIVLFRHVNPDPDALGSQRGLKLWLENKYPDKTVWMAGTTEGMDTVPQEEVQKSLVIITDTANEARIDGDYWKQAARIGRIDHHIKVEDFGPMDIVDEQAAATCEILPLLLKEKGEVLPAESAQAFMEGLMADTQRFTIKTVTPRTFEAAAWLMDMGANPQKAAEAVFSVQYDAWRYETLIRKQSTKKDRFLYAVMDAQQYLSIPLSFEQAKEHVSALGAVEEVEVWALFTQMPDGIHYAGSLRSKTIPVRDLAVEYSGGGHDCACGLRNLSVSDVSSLIDKLALRSMAKK